MTDTTVHLNPDYARLYCDGQWRSAYTPESWGGVPGQMSAWNIPGGYWAVKFEQRGDEWAAFATPVRLAVAEPFDIATGLSEQAVRQAGIEWKHSAAQAVGQARIVFDLGEVPA